MLLSLAVRHLSDRWKRHLSRVGQARTVFCRTNHGAPLEKSGRKFETIETSAGSEGGWTRNAGRKQRPSGYAGGACGRVQGPTRLLRARGSGRGRPNAARLRAPQCPVVQATWPGPLPAKDERAIGI